MASCETPTVFVVDDEPDVRESVAVLTQAMGLSCRTFASAEAFLGGYRAGTPGCLVTDIRLLGMNGLELIQALAAHGITLPVVAISGYADTELAVEVMRSGAVTMLEKPCPRDELIGAIHDALRRDELNRRTEKERRGFLDRLATLRDDERRVLDGMIMGKPNKSIARVLEVSIRTVENRRAQVFNKMKCRTVADLVRNATRAGYVCSTEDW